MIRSIIIAPALLTILVLAGVLVPTPLAYADESETNTEQRLSQKNVGSGGSTNTNCAENAIASESVLCSTPLEETVIPPGPTPPPTGPFTISGEGTGTIACDPPVPPGDISISIFAEGDGTVTGTFTIEHPGIGFSRTFTVTDGTTDGSTFSLSTEEESICIPISVGPITVSGDCGTNVAIRYEDPSAVGTFTGNVECTFI